MKDLYPESKDLSFIHARSSASNERKYFITTFNVKRFDGPIAPESPSDQGDPSSSERHVRPWAEWPGGYGLTISYLLTTHARTLFPSHANDTPAKLSEDVD